MKKYYFLVLLFIGLLSYYPSKAQSFSPDIVVDINGTGNFTSIQAAINAAPAGTPTIIYIKNGLYNQEKLIVPANKTNLTIIGESRNQTIIAYDIFNCNDGGDGLCPDAKVALWSSNTDLIRTAATLTIMANDFKAENITIKNTNGNVGQAQALTITSDRNVFINCDILAYQDTIYFWCPETARSYFKSCVIEGRTDYIYGRGIGFFNECEIRSFGGGWITAPSSTITQTYGFVFYKCNLTYNANSPSATDNGQLIRLGRPWHEYPKVSWLYCTMPAEIHPQGWGDKWNMAYSDTSPDLKLYEWMNTGPGADMSGRANWVGLRAMANQTEANLYEPNIVLAGADNWNPTLIAPAVTVYDWDGGAANTGWLEANNWNPNGVPTTTETANVNGNFTLNSNGGNFLADLNLMNGASIDISANSTTNLLTLNQATISSAAAASLAGTIKTKGAATINTSGNLNITAAISGVHAIAKTGTGITQLSGNNAGYTGNLSIEAGELQAKTANSLGNAIKITVKTAGKLTIDVSNAIQTKTPLYTEGTAAIVLNQDITISEWYIDGVLKAVGTYDAATNPATISGTGKIIIGRPSQFNFVGGSVNRNWDNPAHYSPALLPELGERVNVKDTYIEAIAANFKGDMYISNAKYILLRTTSALAECKGPVTMEQGTSINYATSGTGFYLKAPIVLNGDITLFMSSANTAGSTMDLPGTFSGSYKIKVNNNRSGLANTATVKLGGDNSSFTGIWDLSIAATTAGGSTAINGTVENAFGKGTINLAASNKAIFNHAKCAGDELNMNITGSSASAVLNVAVTVKKFTLNGTQLANGTYNATTHPGLLTGTGSITVDTALGIEEKVFLVNGTLNINGNLEELAIYNILGQRVHQTKTAQEIDLNSLKSGLYIVRYKIDGKQGAAKIYKK